MINQNAQRFALTPGQDLLLDQDGGRLHAKRRRDGPTIDAFDDFESYFPKHPYNLHDGEPGDKYGRLAEIAAEANAADFRLNPAHVIPAEVIKELVDGAWANKNIEPGDHLEALCNHIVSPAGEKLREIIKKACTELNGAPFVIVRGSDKNSQYGTGAGAPSEFCQRTPESVRYHVLKVISRSLLLNPAKQYQGNAAGLAIGIEPVVGDLRTYPPLFEDYAPEQAFAPYVSGSAIATDHSIVVLITPGLSGPALRSEIPACEFTFYPDGNVTVRFQLDNDDEMPPITVINPIGGNAINLETHDMGDSERARINLLRPIAESIRDRVAALSRNLGDSPIYIEWATPKEDAPPVLLQFAKIPPLNALSPEEHEQLKSMVQAGLGDEKTRHGDFIGDAGFEAISTSNQQVSALAFGDVIGSLSTQVDTVIVISDLVKFLNYLKAGILPRCVVLVDSNFFDTHISNDDLISALRNAVAIVVVRRDKNDIKVLRGLTQHIPGAMRMGGRAIALVELHGRHPSHHDRDILHRGAIALPLQQAIDAGFEEINGKFQVMCTEQLGDRRQGAKRGGALALIQLSSE